MAKKKASAGYGCLWWLFIGWWWEIGKMIAKLIAKLVSSATSKSAGGSSPEMYIRGEKISDQDWRQIMESQRQLREQTERLYKFRRKDLIEIGTDIELITEEKIVEDAMGIVNELCGADISPQERAERIEIAPQALTKTGKCPKCIAIARCSWRWEESSRTVCHISYLSNAQPFKADVLRLVRNEPVHYTVRTVDGEMQVVEKY